MPYLTPQDLPEDDDCRPLSIPASTEWLALFGGALTELTKTWNWEDSGGLTVAETVAKMTEIIDNWYTVSCNTCTLPAGGSIIRINLSGKIEILQGGEWVEPTEGDYYIPPPEPREGGAPEDQICLAAKNAVNVLSQLYETLSEAFADNLSTAEALTAFIAALIAAVGFAFAPITAAIAAFFLAVFEALYAALAYISADLWTSEFDDVLTCILAGCASNTAGVVTFDNDCFNNAMNAQVDAGGLSEVQLRLFTQIGYILYFIGGIDGLNLAGRTTEITNDDCSFCECCTECPVTCYLPTGAEWSQTPCTSEEGDFLAFDGLGMYSTLSAFGQGAYVDLSDYVAAGDNGWCVCINGDVVVTGLEYGTGVNPYNASPPCVINSVGAGVGLGEPFQVPADHPIVAISWAAGSGGHVTEICVEPCE